MKILVLQDYLRSGGTERQSLLLAEGLRGAGHAVQLLTFRPGGPLFRGAPHVQALQSRDSGLDWYAPGLRRRIAREKPDVLMAMGRMANCHLGLLRGLVARATHRRGRLIATFRTGKPLPWLYRRALAGAHAVVANSEEAARTLQDRYRVPPGKIHVIYNSLVVDPRERGGAEGEAVAQAMRSSQQAGPGTFVLLNVAMFRPEKNQRGLIEIVNGLPPDGDWQLWLAGDGPTRAACSSLAERLGLAARVRFLGFQTDPSALYAAADAAVHASRSEALSNFLIEAQAHGLPAVAYAAQGVSECFVPGRTGWVIAENDDAAFRAALQRLMQAGGPEGTARHDEAVAFALSRFDPIRQVQAYASLFAEVAAP